MFWNVGRAEGVSEIEGYDVADVVELLKAPTRVAIAGSLVGAGAGAGVGVVIGFVAGTLAATAEVVDARASEAEIVFTLVSNVLVVRAAAFSMEVTACPIVHREHREHTAKAPFLMIPQYNRVGNKVEWRIALT